MGERGLAGVVNFSVLVSEGNPVKSDISFVGVLQYLIAYELIELNV